jgi:hypothetical protein
VPNLEGVLPDLVLIHTQAKPMQAAIPSTKGRIARSASGEGVGFGKGASGGEWAATRTYSRKRYIMF